MIQGGKFPPCVRRKDKYEGYYIVPSAPPASCECVDESLCDTWNYSGDWRNVQDSSRAG